MNKLISFLLHPRQLLFSIGMHGWIRFLRDETYLRLMYWCKFAKRLNLQNPQTFNEKLQWLKLNYRNPLFTKMVDKYEAKKYVASMIGEEYMIPTLGVWDSFDEIDFSQLPDRFVLKCTHDSGGLVICHNKNTLDYAAARKKIQKCLKRNYYWVGREWPYKNVKPRIIAEQFMKDEQVKDLWDYKFFVFDGKVKMMFICQSRGKGTTKADYFTRDFEHLDLTWGYPQSEYPLEKPKEFETMIQLAEHLGQKLPVVRVDFYLVNGKIYFGEMTFYDGSGFDTISTEAWDRELGSWIKLP